MAVRVVVLLGLALVIGVGTIIFAKRWIASVQQPGETQVEIREVEPDSFVLVAQGNLQPGMLLGPDSFRWQGWPTDSLPPSYMVQGKRNETEFHGAVVRRPIAAGEPITAFKIAMPGQQGFLAAVLKPGMRAVTLPINATRASAGFILPGDRVDVLLTHDVGFGTVSETVFFDMRILAIDQALASPEGPARLGSSATLEVTPREVEAFTLMQQMGTVSLSLRSLQPGDGEELSKDQLMAAEDEFDDEAQASAGPLIAEKPETVEKVPTAYPGASPDDATANPEDHSVANAVGQSLGEMGSLQFDDEHSVRRQDQTFTGARDISVLYGGGGEGTIIVIRGDASQ